MKFIHHLIAAGVSLSAALMPLPANAAMSTCWLSLDDSPSGSPQACDVTYRMDGGRKVIDVRTPSDGGMVSIILWMDEYRNPRYAEVYHKPGRSGSTMTRFNYEFDEDGDLRLWLPNTNFQFWVSLPAGLSFNQPLQGIGISSY